MRTRKQALEYGLSFPDTYTDAPFHDNNWQLVRFGGNGKAFLWTYERGVPMLLVLMVCGNDRRIGIAPEISLVGFHLHIEIDITTPFIRP